MSHWLLPHLVGKYESSLAPPISQSFLDFAPWSHPLWRSAKSTSWISTDKMKMKWGQQRRHDTAQQAKRNAQLPECRAALMPSRAARPGFQMFKINSFLQIGPSACCHVWLTKKHVRTTKNKMGDLRGRWSFFDIFCIFQNFPALC